jgi:hypothetical protein
MDSEKRIDNCSSEARFRDNGHGTLTDNVLGVMWVKEPHALSGNINKMNHKDAMSFVRELYYAGFSDWRLPSVKWKYYSESYPAELETLGRDESRNWVGVPTPPFIGIHSSDYWTPFDYGELRFLAQVVNMQNGEIKGQNKGNESYMFPVRGQLKLIYCNDLS